MPRYLEILANQSPFSIGSVGDNAQTRVSCNYATQIDGPSYNVELNIKDLLVSRGLGTYGTNIFVGPKATIPNGDGPYIQIIATGGLSFLETHNDDVYPRPWFQIIVYATNYLTGMNKSIEIWNEIGRLRNITI